MCLRAGSHFFLLSGGVMKGLNTILRNIGAVNSSYSQEESSVSLFDSEYLFSYWLLEDRTVPCRANMVENEIYNAVLCVVMIRRPILYSLKWFF